jgi:hypothetical protein
MIAPAGGPDAAWGVWGYKRLALHDRETLVFGLLVNPDAAMIFPG